MPKFRNWPNNRRGRCCLVGNWYPCSRKLDTRTYCISSMWIAGSSSIVVHRRLWDTQGPSLPPPETAPPRQDQSWPTFQKGFPSPSPVVHAFLTSFARFFPEILERDHYRLFHDQKSVKHEQECKLKGKSISPSTSQSHHHLTIFALLRFNRSSHQGRTMLPKIFCLHGISTYYQSLFAIWITDINWRQNKISIKLRAKWWLHL